MGPRVARTRTRLSFAKLSGARMHSLARDRTAGPKKALMTKAELIEAVAKEIGQPKKTVAPSSTKPSIRSRARSKKKSASGFPASALFRCVGARRGGFQSAHQHADDDSCRTQRRLSRGARTQEGTLEACRSARKKPRAMSRLALVVVIIALLAGRSAAIRRSRRVADVRRRRRDLGGCRRALDSAMSSRFSRYAQRRQACRCTISCCTDGSRFSAMGWSRCVRSRRCSASRRSS